MGNMGNGLESWKVARVVSVVLDSACVAMECGSRCCCCGFKMQDAASSRVSPLSMPARSIGGSPGNEWQRGVTLSTRDDAMHW